MRSLLKSITQTVGRNEDKLAIPSFILGIFSFAASLWLWRSCNSRIARLQNHVQTTIPPLFGGDLDLAYRRLLLLRHLKYMSAFDVLISIWVVINWGSIALFQSYGFQENPIGLCSLAAMLNAIAFNGTVLCYVLVTITILSELKVGFGWRCCDGWSNCLWRRIYPRQITTDRQWSITFWSQMGVALLILLIIVLWGIPAYIDGAQSNSSHPNVVDWECFIKGSHESPMIIAAALALTSVVLVWYKRLCPSPMGNLGVIVSKSYAMTVTGFAAAYWVAWFWVGGLRLWGFGENGGTSPKLWALCIHHYMLAMMPIFNVLVWWKYDPGLDALAANPPQAGGNDTDNDDTRLKGSTVNAPISPLVTQSSLAYPVDYGSL